MADDTPQMPEQGRALHRRETRRQIWLPLLLGIGAIFLPVVLIAIQRDAIWRIRAAAIGDFLYTILCAMPLLLCSFLAYLVIMILVIAMNKLHRRTETPLERVEGIASTLATRIEAFSNTVNERTVTWSARLEHLMTFLDLFDDVRGEHTNDTTNEQSK